MTELSGQRVSVHLTELFLIVFVYSHDMATAKARNSIPSGGERRSQVEIYQPVNESDFIF